MIVTREHLFTGLPVSRDLDITQEQYDDWISGMCIQEAMPNLSPSEREFLKTGLDDDDWDSLFGDD